MDDLGAAPNPEGDLQHAHAMLESMTPEELLKATYALEEIVEQTPRWQEKMNKLNQEAEASGWVTTEELLDELGFKKEDFPGLAGTRNAHNEAA